MFRYSGLYLLIPTLVVIGLLALGGSVRADDEPEKVREGQ